MKHARRRGAMAVVPHPHGGWHPMAMRRAGASLACAMRRRRQGSSPRRRAGSIPQMDDVAPHDAAYAARPFLPSCRSALQPIRILPANDDDDDGVASRRAGRLRADGHEAASCAPVTALPRRDAPGRERPYDLLVPGSRRGLESRSLRDLFGQPGGPPVLHKRRSTPAVGNPPLPVLQEGWEANPVSVPGRFRGRIAPCAA